MPENQGIYVQYTLDVSQVLRGLAEAKAAVNSFHAEWKRSAQETSKTLTQSTQATTQALRGNTAASSSATTQQKRLNTAVVTGSNYFTKLARTVVASYLTYNVFARSLRAVNTALVGSTKAGLQFNETMESARLGIAALITATRPLFNVEGRMVEGAAKFGMALGIASEEMEKLRIAGLSTVATTEQLVEGYQQAVGPLSQAGVLTKDILGFTVRIVQAAGALGMPMFQIAEEIRSIASGTINMHSRIAKVLGITNQLVKQWKESGTFIEEINKRMDAFNIAGIAAFNTWRGIKSNMEEAIGFLAGRATSPLFDSLKKSALNVVNSIFTIDLTKGIFEISSQFQPVIDDLKSSFAKLGGVIEEVFTPENVRVFTNWLAGAVKGAADLASWFKNSVIPNLDTIKTIATGIVAGWSLWILYNNRIVRGLWDVLTLSQSIAASTALLKLAFIGAGVGVVYLLQYIQSLHTTVKDMAKLAEVTAQALGSASRTTDTYQTAEKALNDFREVMQNTNSTFADQDKAAKALIRIFPSLAQIYDGTEESLKKLNDAAARQVELLRAQATAQVVAAIDKAVEGIARQEEGYRLLQQRIIAYGRDQASVSNEAQARAKVAYEALLRDSNKLIETYTRLLAITALLEKAASLGIIPEGVLDRYKNLTARLLMLMKVVADLGSGTMQSFLAGLGKETKQALSEMDAAYRDWAKTQQAVLSQMESERLAAAQKASDEYLKVMKKLDKEIEQWRDRESRKSREAELARVEERYEERRKKIMAAEEHTQKDLDKLNDRYKAERDVVNRKWNDKEIREANKKANTIARIEDKLRAYILDIAGTEQQAKEELLRKEVENWRRKAEQVKVLAEVETKIIAYENLRRWELTRGTIQDILWLWRDYAKMARDIHHGFINNISNDFENWLSNVMQRKFHDLGDAWQALLDALYKDFTDWLAKLVVALIKSGLFNLLATGPGNITVSGVGGGVGGAIGNSVIGSLVGAGVKGLGNLVGVSDLSGKIWDALFGSSINWSDFTDFGLLDFFNDLTVITPGPDKLGALLSNTGAGGDIFGLGMSGGWITPEDYAALTGFYHPPGIVPIDQLTTSAAELAQLPPISLEDYLIWPGMSGGIYPETYGLLSGAPASVVTALGGGTVGLADAFGGLGLGGFAGGGGVATGLGAGGAGGLAATGLAGLSTAGVLGGIGVMLPLLSGFFSAVFGGDKPPEYYQDQLAKMTVGLQDFADKGVTDANDKIQLMMNRMHQWREKAGLTEEQIQALIDSIGPLGRLWDEQTTQLNKVDAALGRTNTQYSSFGTILGTQYSSLSQAFTAMNVDLEAGSATWDLLNSDVGDTTNLLRYAREEFTKLAEELGISTDRVNVWIQALQGSEVSEWSKIIVDMREEFRKASNAIVSGANEAIPKIERVGTAIDQLPKVTDIVLRYHTEGSLQTFDRGGVVMPIGNLGIPLVADAGLVVPNFGAGHVLAAVLPGEGMIPPSAMAKAPPGAFDRVRRGDWSGQGMTLHAPIYISGITEPVAVAREVISQLEKNTDNLGMRAKRALNKINAGGWG